MLEIKTTTFTFSRGNDSVKVTPDGVSVYEHQVRLAYKTVFAFYKEFPTSAEKVSLVQMVQAYTNLPLKEAKVLVEDAQYRAELDIQQRNASYED